MGEVIPRSSLTDTEGFELRRLPWWWSPRLRKQVHIDAYLALRYWDELTRAEISRFFRPRGFPGYQPWTLKGEQERGELEERKGLFRVDPTRPTIIRRYIRRRYVPTVLTTYTIIEKLKYLRIYMTFSIETGSGHEPFMAEVTCNTVVPPDLTEAERKEKERRIVNGVLKLFFILFDWNKIVYKGDPDELWRALYYLRDYARPVYESQRPPRLGLDEFLMLPIIQRRIRSRSPDEFVTRESVITIGVEYESTPSLYPEYPEVHCYIEKVKKGHFKDERVIVLAPTTRLWMDELLGMVIS